MDSNKGFLVLQGAVSHSSLESDWEAVPDIWSRGWQLPQQGGSDNHCDYLNSTCEGGISGTRDKSWEARYTNFHSTCWVTNITHAGIFEAWVNGRCSSTQMGNLTAIKLTSGEVWMGESIGVLEGAMLEINYTGYVWEDVPFVNLIVKTTEGIVLKNSSYNYGDNITSYINVSNAKAVWVKMVQDIPDGAGTDPVGQVALPYENTTSNPIFLNQSRKVNITHPSVHLFESTDDVRVEFNTTKIIKAEYDKAIWVFRAIEVINNSITRDGDEITVNVTIVPNQYLELGNVTVFKIPVYESNRRLFLENGTEITNDTSYNFTCSPEGKMGYCSFEIRNPTSNQTFFVKSNDTFIACSDMDSDNSWDGIITVNASGNCKKIHWAWLNATTEKIIIKSGSYNENWNMKVDKEFVLEDGPNIELGKGYSLIITSNGYIYGDGTIITDRRITENGGRCNARIVYR
jgi:hypothetical protein